VIGKADWPEAFLVMGSNDPSTQAPKASEQDQPSATTSGATASVYPEWASFQAYSAIPPHGFFPPTVAANPQAHPYMWGAQVASTSVTLCFPPHSTSLFFANLYC